MTNNDQTSWMKGKRELRTKLNFNSEQIPTESLFHDKMTNNDQTSWMKSSTELRTNLNFNSEQIPTESLFHDKMTNNDQTSWMKSTTELRTEVNFHSEQRLPTSSFDDIFKDQPSWINESEVNFHLEQRPHKSLFHDIFNSKKPGITRKKSQRKKFDMNDWMKANIKLRQPQESIFSSGAQSNGEIQPKSFSPTPSDLPTIIFPKQKQEDIRYSGAQKSEEREPELLHDDISEEDDSITKCSTNAFGDIKFVGYGRKIAKFARVDHETSMETIMDMITKWWKLSLPNLLISVAGGRKHFQLKPHLKKVFECGLIKAATSTGAWIISEGLYAGVVKNIGNAIQDNGCSLTGNNKAVTISIASWNCVQKKEDLIDGEGSWPAEYHITNTTGTKICSLEPNHSYFIFVDDGTKKTVGVETNFRKAFENTIAIEKIIQETEEVKIPVVVVLVEGGPETLKSVLSSIENHIPVIVVKGSGGAADIMAYAYQTAFENVDGNGKNITDGRLPEEKKMNIRKEIIKEFESYSHVEELVTGVCRSLKNPHLITLFAIDSSEDFDITIFNAVFKANNNKLEQLRLALEWNRIDIANSEIFTEEALWPNGTLGNLMLFALRKDRVNFVKLFMEHGVSLKKLLTKERIEDLYNKTGTNDDRMLFVNFVGRFVEHGVSLKQFLTKEESNGKQKNKEADKLDFTNILFLWSVLLNRKEMAFLFWKEGMEALPSAIFANKLLRILKLKNIDHDQRIQFQEHADLFQKRAIGVLTECHSSDEKGTLDLLVLPRKIWKNASCMQIAFNENNKKFISQNACQNLLTNIWMGEMSPKTSIWKLILCTLCPLFIFLIKFVDNSKSTLTEELNDDDSDYSENLEEQAFLQQHYTSILLYYGNSPKQQKICCEIFNRLRSFYTAPIIKFMNNLIMYIIFLSIYSYVVLVELKPQISNLEWLLLVWVTGIFTEEINQILTKRISSLWKRFVSYINDIWNIVDVITIILFIIGILLRWLKLPDTARVVLSLNLISFYIRILHMFSVHKHLGPKLVMIKKMMRDLGYFIMILFVFMIAYGIASQSILKPSTPISYDLFKGVFRKAYFHMYGELFLDDYEDPKCDVNNECPSKVGTYVAPILMCLYILLTNILLLNLLIAMFSSTFQKVQEMSYLHWSFQRYDLILEFYTRPPLAPPLILFSHIYLCCRYLYTRARHLEYNRPSPFVKKYEIDDVQSLIIFEDQMVDSYMLKEDNSDSNNKYFIDQLTSKVKYENSNQRLQNIEEKINGLDSSLAWIKQKLKQQKHYGDSSC